MLERDFIVSTPSGMEYEKYPRRQNSLGSPCLEILSMDFMVQAIHECVYFSTIRHVLKLPITAMITYFSTFPFYRGADTLYYFILKKHGRDMYYAQDGRHLITINHELIGVYILAEQDLKAPKMLNSNNSPNSDDSIYSILKPYIDRTITCPRYQLRNTIILGEAVFEDAINIPSIALNIPIYQEMFQRVGNHASMIRLFTDNDCLEPMQSLNVGNLAIIISRMAMVKGLLPNLWNLVLKDYYSQQLLRLQIHNQLLICVARELVSLNSLIPEIIQLPSDLSTLGVRLWFSSRPDRAYLLGFDLTDGIPADSIISERLQHLEQVGIEQYTDAITGVHVDDTGNLTGQIGMITYPQLVGKKLVNTKDVSGTSLSVYFPFDLFPIAGDTWVYIISFQDIIAHVRTDGTITREYLQGILTKENMPGLIEVSSEKDIERIFTQLTCPLKTFRGTHVRNRLVEIMCHDMLKF